MKRQSVGMIGKGLIVFVMALSMTACEETLLEHDHPLPEHTHEVEEHTHADIVNITRRFQTYIESIWQEFERAERADEPIKSNLFVNKSFTIRARIIAFDLQENIFSVAPEGIENVDISVRYTENVAEIVEALFKRGEIYTITISIKDFLISPARGRYTLLLASLIE